MKFSPSLKIKMHSHSSKSVITTLWTALKKHWLEAAQEDYGCKTH